MLTVERNACFCSVIILLCAAIAKGECDVHKVDCVKNADYNDYQYAICVETNELRKMWDEKYSCLGNQRSCFLPCMRQIYGKSDGIVEDLCTCTDDKHGGSWWYDWFCWSPWYKGKCNWFEDCFEERTKCNNVQPLILPFLTEFCDDKSLEMTEAGKEYMNSFIICVQNSLVYFVRGSTSKNCKKAALTALLFSSRCTDTKTFCSLHKDDMDAVFRSTIMPTLRKSHNHGTFLESLNCVLKKSESLKLLRFYLMDRLISDLNAHDFVDKVSKQLFHNTDITSIVINYRNTDYDFKVLLVGEDDDINKLKNQYTEAFLKWPILLKYDSHFTRVDKISVCKSVECEDKSEAFSVDFKNYVCDGKTLTDMENLASVDENAPSVDCCSGSEGAQCVALAKCQCRVPRTCCWVPKRKAYGQACGHEVETQTLKREWSDRFYEVSTVNEKGACNVKANAKPCRHDGEIAFVNKWCRRRYKTIQGTKKSFQCTSEIMSKLEMGAIKKVISKRRGKCNCDQKNIDRGEEAMVSCLCNVPATSSWIPGQQISSNCSYYSIGKVVATFSGIKYTTRYKNAKDDFAGILKFCNESNIEIYTQNCSKEGVQVLNIHSDHSKWGKVYEVACDEKTDQCSNYDAKFSKTVCLNESKNFGTILP